jgi:hypothetical protein
VSGAERSIMGGFAAGAPYVIGQAWLTSLSRVMMRRVLEGGRSPEPYHLGL